MIFSSVRRLLSLGRPIPVDPDFPWQVPLWRDYDRLAHRRGFDHRWLILSFDCDRPEDAVAAPELVEGLRRRGITPILAVPGSTLLDGAEVYSRLAANGAEFMNHGFRPHTEWHDGRYRSITFYDSLTPQETAEDVVGGHRAIQEVTGQHASGFRPPHFGCLQSPERMNIILAELRRLGYRWASQTMPSRALAEGPVIPLDGIWEFPVMGSFRNPNTILDSWTYVRSPHDPVIRDEYADLLMETASQFQRRKLVGLLNLYADPSHVVGNPRFWTAIDHVLACGFRATTFDALVNRLVT